MSDPPCEIGVFPLPDIVLFPGALLPLHVFEPRYRALIADALASHRTIALAVLKPAPEPAPAEIPAVHPIACVGKIVQHKPLTDGRSDIVLRGCRVVEIERFVRSEPYRVARVKTVEQNDCFVTAPGAKERVQELHDLLELSCPGSLAKLRDTLHLDGSARSALDLLHLVAMHLPVQVDLKLQWLACPGSLTRWRMIRKKLGELAASRSLGKDCLARYDDLRPEHPQKN